MLLPSARIKWIAAAAGLALAAAAGCTLDDPRYKPVVLFVQTPPAAVPEESTVTVVWTGEDFDENITNYDYQWNNRPLVSTGDTVVVHTFVPTDGTRSEPKVHVFRVRADDSTGLIGDFVQFTITVGMDFTLALTAAPPEYPVYAGESAEFEWRQISGRPADSYEYAVNDTSSWTATQDTSAVLDASALGSPLEPRLTTFYLRGIGIDGYSDLVTWDFLAGPVIPLDISFTAVPDPPPAVAEDSVELAWEVNAGFAQSFEYALDDTASWTGVEDTVLTLDMAALGNPEAARRFTFYLRAVGVGGHSNVLSAEFIAGPLTSVILVFVDTPPAPPVYAGETVDFSWEIDAGVLDGGFNYALDDTSTWKSTDLMEITLDNAALGSPNSPRHFTFYLRALGVGGYSNVLSWQFISGPKSPPPDTTGS